MLQAHDSSARATLSFTLEHWCLWQSKSAPIEAIWPNGRILPVLAGGADVSFLPMMQRRRLSPMARAACAVAWDCRETHGDMPAVFFSRHGESQYYLEILSGLAAEAGVSPSRFSLSVHNAIGGLHGLHAQSFQPYVTLAGGDEGFFGPFLEAAGLLLDVPQVLLVWHEQVLPAIYRAGPPSSRGLWALAMVLGGTARPGPQLKLIREATAMDADADSDAADPLPAMLCDRRSGSCRLERATWHWNLQHA
ncbi:beta-ketoacyl synthase chain length factor [Methylomonas sp. SURF-2]|uniref:Beta-ketoacyl synthase chain length factor n=1 Tax=Methylomonas subterranea TaxID=2952225 RepID=A0ABT1TKY3_9GAMM|nr:beta-ketoacyl synthase chain length factor [Methylomonas sp. SURF-2]MCQ8105409.1 beta-ketoacyl synthase chain length factor [Methylomonas sp. SURF-2]